MTERKINGVPINDGKGLYDNDGILETVIMDCNNAIKSLTEGNYISFCNIMVQIVRKISNVRDGIKAEDERKQRQIEELKAINNRLQEQVTGLPVDDHEEKDGAQ